MKILGLMSGTSLDGIDAAVVDIRPREQTYDVRCERFTTIPFQIPLRQRLLAALPPHEPSVAEYVELDAAVGEALARVALGACAGFAVDAVASHGLTLHHRGEVGLTLQIGDPYRVRDAVRATVVADFRRADCALGGHGAPLVPHFDALAFGSAERDVVALNLGGMANVSVIARGTRTVSAAWDTGPGNVLVDAFVAARTGGRETYDAMGAYAAAGRANLRLVAALANDAHDYLVAAPPKSTGRERFGPDVLARHAAAFAALSLEDGCATLAAFTLESIVASLERYGPERALLVVSGGGVHNIALFGGLRERLGRRGWETSSSLALGVDPDAKEAIAFAVFAYETLRGRPANVPAATGARAPTVLGAIVPYELEALLAKIRTELTAKTLR